MSVTALVYCTRYLFVVPSHLSGPHVIVHIVPVLMMNLLCRYQWGELTVLSL